MALHCSEDLAAAYLRCHGLVLVDKNYRCRRGEIDRVMMEAAPREEILVFVKFRYRKSSAYGAPAESVTKIKQKRIITAATNYMATTNTLNCAARFDVIAVTRPHYLPDVQWIKYAFA